MATECHQRTRPLWRRHGDIPRTPHGGLPTTCHDGADCHHRRLQCSPIRGRSRRATDARGRSSASGHAASGPAGSHSLSTRPALAQTTTTLHGRFPHRPLLRGLGTRRDDTGAIPRPTIQDQRTSTPRDTNQGTSGTPGLQGWHGPQRATSHQAARRARHPQILGGSSCMVKNEGKGRKMTCFQRHPKKSCFAGYYKTVADKYGRLNISIRMMCPMGETRKSIVWWPFFARGLAQRRSFVSD